MPDRSYRKAAFARSKVQTSPLPNKTLKNLPFGDVTPLTLTKKPLECPHLPLPEWLFQVLKVLIRLKFLLNAGMKHDSLLSPIHGQLVRCCAAAFDCLSFLFSFPDRIYKLVSQKVLCNFAECLLKLLIIKLAPPNVTQLQLFAFLSPSCG